MSSTDSTPRDARLRVLITGSCVSRDTFEFLSPRAFELVDYVARQSLISAFSPPAPVPTDVEAMPSPFQRRMCASDATSGLPAAVVDVARSTDLLLWDLVDERLGVWEHRGGGWSTDSVELRAARASSGSGPVGAVHHAFGSTTHRRMFDDALLRWRALLVETGLHDRTVLVAPRWAELSTTGDPTPPSFEFEAAHANALFDDYVERARDVVGVPVVARDDQHVRAEADHKWGLAPFHYDDETYLRTARGILDVMGSSQASEDHGTASGDLVRATSMRRVGSSPTVTLHQSSRSDVTAAVHNGTGRAFAFHLFSGDRIVAKQHYGPSATFTFDVSAYGQGPFHVKAYVLQDDDTRLPLVSPRMRLRRN